MVFLVGDAYLRLPLDEGDESVVGSFVLAEAFALVEGEERDRAAGVLQENAAYDRFGLILESGGEIYDLGVGWIRDILG